jgi:hypothetical protein
MKLDNFYWLYQVECIPTGRIYIGQTGKPNPCWRWSDHFVDLRNGISRCVLLQAEWNLYPELVYWRFQALDRVEGKRVANQREAEFVLGTPPEKRLNCIGTSCISLERRRKIESMLREGRKYREITQETGITGGMISRINKILQADQSLEVSHTPTPEEVRVTAAAGGRT